MIYKWFISKPVVSIIVSKTYANNKTNPAHPPKKTSRKTIVSIRMNYRVSDFKPTSYDDWYCSYIISTLLTGFGVDIYPIIISFRISEGNNTKCQIKCSHPMQISVLIYLFPLEQFRIQFKLALHSKTSYHITHNHYYATKAPLHDYMSHLGALWIKISWNSS